MRRDKSETVKLVIQINVERRQKNKKMFRPEDSWCVLMNMVILELDWLTLDSW